MSTRRPILFYDIPSTVPGSAFSPNTWKTRYSLNYKNVLYQTIWVEYPDIAVLCKKLGVPPTNSAGNLIYTLPVIHDPETGRSISDSLDIAIYLDEQFPEPHHRRLIPQGALALHMAFEHAYLSMIVGHLRKFTTSRTLEILNPASQSFFRSTREARFGLKIEDIAPKGEDRTREWEAVEEKFGVVDKWLRKQEVYEGQGPFLTGQQPRFSDFVMAGFVMWIQRLWGKESEEWERVKTWQGGRWARLLDSLEAYGVLQ